MYQILRRLLFNFDAEKVHYFSMNLFRTLNGLPITGNILRNIFRYSKPGLERELCGLKFRNPVGLAAGFDKNALYLNELEAIGFGSVEIGTVTPLPQKGNDKPRLFRLPKDGALINRMGFNNDGAHAIAARLEAWRKKPHKMIIGGNIGKNKVTPNDEAWLDYEICYRTLYPWVDYFVVNVSSPNTPGLRELQEKESLRKILTNLQEKEIVDGPSKPLFLKLAPDLTTTQLDEVIDLALEINLDGLIIANTTIERSGLETSAAELEKIGAGGLSGKPLTKRSTEIVRYIKDRSAGKINIIASGGIFTAEDAIEKLAAGASLVQVWTGFIYEGPGIVKNICKGL